MKQRADIQALRALAVSMVVIFHLKATLLPGGFAGVDVFFVISGFLISSSLVGEVTRTGKIAFAKFWARRARRLLPVSLFVIAATAFASLFVLEPFTRSDSFWDSVASIFYLENWRLGFAAADYFSAPSPSLYQHYWSLGVEEQFYLAWPLLILVFSGLRAVRFRTLAIAAITVASFGYSAALTFTGDQFAYFSTFGRAWEFGAGALVTLWLTRKPSGLKPAFGVIGFATILISAFALKSTDPFPGFLALIPVVGAALVVAAAQEGAITRLLAFKPIQWLGDQSYGIYLWHWPAVLLVPKAFPQLGSAVVALIALTSTLVLAPLSKRFIEDPIREQGLAWLKSAPKSLGLSLLATLAALGLVLGVGSLTSAQVSNARSVTASAQSDPCFGAGSLALPQCQGVDLLPSLSLDQATHDSADPNNKCMTTPKSSEVIPCVVPAEKPKPKRVLLIGDSHAAMYFGPLQILAKQRNWQVTLIYKASCAFNLAPRNKTERGVTCAKWNENIQSWLVGKDFDLVFTSYMASNISTDLETSNYKQVFDQGFKDAWVGLNKDAELIVLRDGPKFTKAMTECYADPKTAATCQMNAADAFTPDRAYNLALSSSFVMPLDMTDLICTSTCKSMVGGLYVYRDTHHLSLAYANSLAPYLLQRLDHLVGAG